MRTDSLSASPDLLGTSAPVDRKDNLALHNSDGEESPVALASSLAGEQCIRARSRDELGKQPMHLAAAGGSDALVSGIANWCDDDTSMLFGELDRQDDFGTTPLAIAAAKAQEGVVDFVC
jgi:hypothetical protein